MNDSLSFDVAVVGAGPAGSAAAYALAKGGLRVVLLEKSELPRYKTCGGGLLGRTLRLLPESILQQNDLIEHACLRAELQHHEPRMSFLTRRSEPVVSMVMRSRFDQALTLAAGKAGARIVTNARVVDLVLRADHLELGTTMGRVTASFVIGADGATSLIARKAGFPDLTEVIPALESEVEVSPEQFEKFSGSARFDFGITPFGYAWVFPKKEHLSIGVLTTRRGSCNLNDEYTRYLAAIGLSHPRKEARHGYMIPIRPRENLFAHARVFLVGDAAGLADPVTAEGISAAVASGQHAAKAILQAGQGGAGDAMRAYRTAMQGTILAELRVARRLAQFLYGAPRLRAWLFRRHGRGLSEFMTDLVMGESHYRSAVYRPVNYLKLFRRRALDPLENSA